jgi:hypothetical protein
LFPTTSPSRKLPSTAQLHPSFHTSATTITGLPYRSCSILNALNPLPHLMCTQPWESGTRFSTLHSFNTVHWGSGRMSYFPKVPNLVTHKTRPQNLCLSSQLLCQPAPCPMHILGSSWSRHCNTSRPTSNMSSLSLRNPVPHLPCSYPSGPPAVLFKNTYCTLS